MKRNSIKLILSSILILIVSCNEPETVITNYVHADGTVTRKIEMHSIDGDAKKRFNNSDIQVPFDSTWSIRDSIKVSAKGDTTWIRTAQKLFKSIDEINMTYKKDSGANREFSRHAGFKKKFRWFNTEFRFSETIDKKLSDGYPVSDFLNKEELLYFYSPESLITEKESGPDSLKFRSLSDSVKLKTDNWTVHNFISEWIVEFSRLISGKADSSMSLRELKSHEEEFTRVIERVNNKADSLWKEGILLKEFIGEANAVKYRSEADSAFEIATKNVLIDFSNYSERIVMPGKVIGTNGFVDSSQILLWPVKADYFLTEPYEMWAESKTTNRWAWIISGLFLLFVLTGVVRKLIKKD